MNIDISFTSDVDFAESLNAQEVSIIEILKTIALYLFENEEILKRSYLSGVNLHDDKEFEFEFLLTDNDTIQELNAEYRNVDAPTDVLTFVMLEDEPAIDLPVLNLGNVIVSINKVLEQALQNDHLPLVEFAYLCTHGYLHLLGLHHDTDDTYKNIVSIQEEVLAYLKANGML